MTTAVTDHQPATEWVILSFEEDLLFWSNTDGWVGLDSADVFTHDERFTVTLPDTGFWVPLTRTESFVEADDDDGLLRCDDCTQTLSACDCDGQPAE